MIYPDYWDDDIDDIGIKPDLPKSSEQDLQSYNQIIETLLNQKSIELNHENVKSICTLPATSVTDSCLDSIIKKTFHIHLKNQALNKLLAGCICHNNEPFALKLLSQIKLVDNIDEKLLEASGKGLLNICSELINKGANVNIQNSIGITPLYNALDKDYTDLTLYLLKNGANPHLKSPIPPLAMACIRGNEVAVKALIDSGAKSPNFIPAWKSWTCTKSNQGILQLLIDAGFNPHIDTPQKKFTPLKKNSL